MGMYNEVYKKCPNCDILNTIQISQIVLGFGCFDLDYGTNIEDLTQDQKHDFAKEVNKETFVCHECGEEHKAHVIVSPVGDPANSRIYI
jgi:hypothetical protein